MRNTEQTCTFNAHRWYYPWETNQCAPPSYLSCDGALNCFTPGITYWIDLHTLLWWEKINVEAFLPELLIGNPVWRRQTQSSITFRPSFAFVCFPPIPPQKQCLSVFCVWDTASYTHCKHTSLGEETHYQPWWLSRTATGLKDNSQSS